MTARLSNLATSAVLIGLFCLPASAQAQTDGAGFAIGPRLTFLRGSVDSTEDAQRFSGGFIRLGGGKTAIELAMDYRSGLTGSLTERIRDYPIQASLLVFPVRARLAPYLLGGIGWYSQNVERLTPGTETPLEKETTRRVGYHAGLGAELRVHRHFGVYGDYRYTFLRFGDAETQVPQELPTTGTPRWIPFAERLRMSHEGSMWTWGANFYF
jgi:hypothetical protein